MAALVGVNPTFIDLQKMLDPSGMVAPVAEILNATNEGLDEMVWQEGNLTTGHRHQVRTGLPAVTWGQLYKGVAASKGTTVQATDNCGFLESLSEVDTRLVNLASNPAQFRFQMDRPHIESMSQEFFRVLFKGTVADTDQFIGFESRFSSLSADNGANIIQQAGVGEDTDINSIWLIGWSDRTVFGIVPKNSTVGLQQMDWGIETVYDSSSNPYKAYRTYWRWDCGLAMPDWRYVVRYQFDQSELTEDGATGVVLPYAMRKMIARLPTDAFNGTRLAFYMNRTTSEKFGLHMENLVKNSTLMLGVAGGQGELSPRRKLNFDGIPINRVDALAGDETLAA